MPLSIIILLAILVLGLIHILWDLYRLRSDKEKLNDYYCTVTNLPEKIVNNQDYSEDVVWILQNTKEIGRIVDADMYSSVWHIRSEITNRNSIGIRHECSRIASDGIVWLSALDAKRKGVMHQLLNPFVWFYRGIELITYIVFGYLIKAVNPDYDFTSKVWKWFNVIFSLVSGAASILSYVAANQ